MAANNNYLGKFGPREADYGQWFYSARLDLIPIGYPTPPPFQSVIFLMNPESITETLQGGWVHKVVPGQNDPISSWVGNGNRTIAINLLLTKDISNYHDPSTSLNPASPNISISGSTPTVLGSISSISAGASSIIAQIKTSISSIETGVAVSGNDPSFINTQNMISKDVTTELTIIRSLRYGELSKGAKYSTSPSLVKFTFFSNQNPQGNNPTLGWQNSGIENVFWTVDTIEIVTTKWSMDLLPLEAEVKLSLTQFNDVNISKNRIYSYKG